MERIIAACGNDCAACPRYVAHPYEKTNEELRHTAELWMKIVSIKQTGAHCYRVVGFTSFLRR